MMFLQIPIFPFRRINNTLLAGLILIIFSNIFFQNTALGQENTVARRSNDLITVFLDFSFYQQYVRETLTYVNYVRDREAAEVHIMMTRYGSGSAGVNYVISFIGRARFEGINNVITYWSPGTNTSVETRRGLVEMLQIGLVPYLAGTRMVKQIAVNINTDIQIEREDDVDPWMNWVFEVYGGGNFHKEEKQSRYNARWGADANKTTKDWKIRLRAYFNQNNRIFLDGDETIISKSHRHGFRGNIIKSIDNHWSGGIFTSLFSSTFHNIHFSMDAAPGIEYSFYPYSEASSRSITMVYRLGAGHNTYIEETVFFKESEILANQSLDFSVAYQQPWGAFRARVRGSHYFHDFASNRAELFMRLDLRVIRGLSLNLQGNLDLINDLVTLPAGELSREELLLQQRQQATNYQVFGSMGLAYRFGSQFTNVVNTRF